MMALNDEAEEVPAMVPLLVKIAQSPRIGLSVLEVTGEMIAEDARLNMWILERKSSIGAVALWNLVGLRSEVKDAINRAWNEHENSADSSERVQRTENLLAVFRSGLDRIRQVRATGVVDYEDPDMPPEIAELG
ncbi:hypothetical protein ACIA8G_21150 [Lentzea sp. NPDC051213]|uniref:hypothetical protein n=1 Tax=Lentzea sp. NPDC051213 TaxID=3364126 RepID=UPI0037B608B6